MKQPFKQSVQQHLNKKKLSNKQLNQLESLQNKHHKQEGASHFSRTTIASVASVLMLSFILSLFYITNETYRSTHSIEQLIAEEVAGNHLKLKPLEVSSNSMQEITSFFKQLSFSPVSPSSDLLSKQTLMGGRYCSIQGVTALQLRIVNNETNKVQSLYETEYDKNIFKNFPDIGEGSNNSLTIYVKGMKVDMWVEKDLFFALIE